MPVAKEAATGRSSAPQAPLSITIAEDDEVIWLDKDNNPLSSMSSGPNISQRRNGSANLPDLRANEISQEIPQAGQAAPEKAKNIEYIDLSSDCDEKIEPETRDCSGNESSPNSNQVSVKIFFYFACFFYFFISLLF